MHCHFAFVLFIISFIPVTFAQSGKTTRHPHLVTYGSMIKLLHVPSNCRLHSHEIPYGLNLTPYLHRFYSIFFHLLINTFSFTGQGSFQQSVTAIVRPDEPNSIWHIKPAHGKYVKRGYILIIRCYNLIKLPCILIIILIFFYVHVFIDAQNSRKMW